MPFIFLTFSLLAFEPLLVPTNCHDNTLLSNNLRSLLLFVVRDFQIHAVILHFSCRHQIQTVVW